MAETLQAKKTVLSGIQPTSRLTLGNYLGARLALSKGSRITKPIILLVLLLLFLKLLGIL